MLSSAFTDFYFFLCLSHQMLGFPMLTLHTPTAFLALILTTPLCWRLQAHNAIQRFVQSNNRYPGRNNSELLHPPLPWNTNTAAASACPAFSHPLASPGQVAGLALQNASSGAGEFLGAFWEGVRAFLAPSPPHPFLLTAMLALMLWQSSASWSCGFELICQTQ